MNRKTMFLCAAALAVCTHARADDAVCGTLESATNGQDGMIALREGESVNFWRGGAVRHGALHVYKDGEVYRVYWQPEGSGDIYVLANEGTSAVRLILTPPRGTKVDTGPGSLPPQKVLSCPAM
ncbi:MULTISPECIES: hypothetical protein [Caballeronia]|jgi:hypothetical protein|uniref:Uncharacterized protein n=1 Tax=Caballeronia zhejiangensis TaxID=871203 RepID=A0A656QHR9_9BURK|nr:MULTISPECIES: hypothetical protein [Caballeronia]EKS69536.1 hypothetical protein BURK_015700 [Burkholderia sp. SJ98]KDR29600.1 hypothetical protein BG60_05855 [Caballeronia zhejiangensis]MCG7405711.1 hypothetical protein [Caballeronia zhejiangensis]MCI1045196.1 hypothetical protein [Caballeronia zhejiangensis]MDR5791217.1 hypothetical protein [Caballeronia sp. LP003]